MIACTLLLFGCMLHDDDVKIVIANNIIIVITFRQGSINNIEATERERERKKLIIITLQLARRVFIQREH